MDRDIKRAKGPDELPIGTKKESILDNPRIEQLEEELRARDATIERLTRENEELQQKLRSLSRTPIKKGAQTRYWRKEEHERFLEALEKYGQRDVKNISAYVGTRSPTQVRTHAQKYFLKQRREETAQMKSANTLARKRRLTMTTATAEEDEEDEEAEEDEELDEDDGEFDQLGNPVSSANAFTGMDVDATGEESNPGRRKSTRASNAAAVIKLRTQDVVAHTQASSSASAKGSAGKRTSSNGGDHLGNAYSGSINGSPSSLSSGPKVKSEGMMSSSSLGGSTTSQGVKGVPNSNSPSNITGGILSSPIASNAKGYGGGVNYGAGMHANQSRGSTPQQQVRNGSGPMSGSNPAAATLYGMSSMSGYGMGSGIGANGAFYGQTGYVPFRTDIFSSAEEAAQFYRAVKMYERETDRSKVLTMIKEYYLPRRTIEEISTMVDLAFPTVDPTSYNAAAATAAADAAAFHPMYGGSGRMPMYFQPHDGSSGFSGPSSHTSNANNPLGNLSHALDLNNASANRGTHSTASTTSGPSPSAKTSSLSSSSPSSSIPSIKLDPSHPYGSSMGYHPSSSSSSSSGSSNPIGSHSFSMTDIGDFSAQTHIDSSSLTSISDHMMNGHMGHNDTRTNSSVRGQNDHVSDSTSSSATSHTPSQSNPPNSSNTSNTTQGNNLTNTSLSTTHNQSSTTQESSSSAISSSDSSSTSTNKKKENEDEDSSLMNELASLTERSSTQSNPSGGLSSFIGGRPLALSPGVFGSSGTTPIGFGMTPLMTNSTPLGFISSPLGLNFSSAQSPLNPYQFGSQK